MNEDLYNALNLMDRRAGERVLSLPKDQQNDFKERLR
jgi:hypothetical protein